MLSPRPPFVPIYSLHHCYRGGHLLLSSSTSPPVILYYVIILTTSLFGQLALGKVDLFVSQEEVNRILGINAVLRYVENGEVHDYAVKHSVLVPSNVSNLTFEWMNNAKYDIKYNISMDASAGIRWKLSVPNAGTLPKIRTPVTVSMLCAPATSGETKLLISFSFDYPSKQNPTQVTLTRRKICKLRSPDAQDSQEHRIDTPTQSVGIYTNAAYPVGAVQIFYIAIGCVCGVIILMASVIVAYFVRVKKPFGNPSTVQLPSNTFVYPEHINTSGQSHPFLPPKTPDTMSKHSDMESWMYGTVGNPPPSAQSVTGGQSVITYGDPNRQVNIDSAIKALQIPLDTIQISEEERLQKGTFGQVLKGQLTLPANRSSKDNDNQPQQTSGRISVIVKTIFPNASESQKYRFLQEVGSIPPQQLFFLQQIAKINQPLNKRKALDELPMLCYKHEGMWNLKGYLLGRSGHHPHHQQQQHHGLQDDTGGQILHNTLTTQDIVHMAMQIISACLHLHQHQILHNDLATRNCLIGSEGRVELCDTGLSRDLFSTDYECLGDNVNRPVKWMAIEALTKDQFSSATDVWSFGVLLWELLSGGFQPYTSPHIDSEDLAVQLINGYRLPQPYNCPDELYGVMFCCWGQYAESRPSFNQLLIALQDFHNQLTQYI